MNEITTTNSVVHLGSCLDVLPSLPDCSVDAIVTDPPYELGFMGKKWDSSGIAFNVDVWTECLRVLKPGGHLLAFGGSRTWHRLAVAIEDAGFEVRDSIAWLYGSGFPKSMDVSKAIDKAAGAERDVLSEEIERSNLARNLASGEVAKGDRLVGSETGTYTKRTTLPATPEAEKWAGWGTALKPAFEPIVVARKPLIGTVAANVLAYGTGAINIDGTRIGGEKWKRPAQSGVPFDGNWKPQSSESNDLGRFPANIILDEYTAELLDEQSGTLKSGMMKAGTPTQGYDGNSMGAWKPSATVNDTYGDSGGASRFFYVAKASKRDRNEGLEHLDTVSVGSLNMRTDSHAERTGAMTKPSKNFHPTVKPTDLMRQLIRLVTPPGGTVLDPFTGSGSTGKAAILEGFQFIGIELTEEYLPIIQGRLEHAEKTIGERFV